MPSRSWTLSPRPRRSTRRPRRSSCCGSASAIFGAGSQNAIPRNAFGRDDEITSEHKLAKLKKYSRVDYEK